MTTTQTNSHSNTALTNRQVAVLGLGSMGAALAGAFLSQGISTTVWNRSADRAEPLRSAGAEVAPDATAAIRSADLVIVCLRDHASTRAVLHGVEPNAFRGRMVINLASSTPDEARETAAWAAEAGISWLSGAIMVPTPMIGTPHGLVLYSGDREVFDRQVDRLEVMAGQADFVGDDPGLASLYDTAMLGVFFAGMTAFLHATAMTTAQGVDAKTFLPYANKMIEILPPTMVGLAADVDSHSYSGTEDNLAMELAALEHIVQTSADLRIDSRLPRYLRDLAAQAVADGHGADGWSRVVEILRRAA